MNDQEREPSNVVDAILPGGTSVRVRVADDTRGGMGSVGLPQTLHIEDALAQIGEVASLLRKHLDPVRPTKVTVEFGVSLAAEPGKLTSLFFEGKGAASLTITLEWEHQEALGPLVD